MKLELKEVACGYSREHVILEHVSFTVASGEICCILGPNGVGKTTLFKSILKLLKLQNGRMLVDGEDISKWSPAKMAKTMAYVSQFHVPPFPYQVKDVVLLGRVNSTGYFGKPGKKDHEIVENAMMDMGVHHLRDKVYTDISGGERQLVMIARALAQEPKLLVLDEPTASLDYGNMIRVMKKIIGLKQNGYAVVMTTHNPDQAFMCDSNVVLLQRNAPIQFGSAIDIITRKNLKQAYGVDVGVIELMNKQGKRIRMCVPVL